jgi:cold shock protein
MKGKVIWFNKKRGYGFITPEDSSKDVFVHYTGISGQEKFKVLENNAKVDFELSENSKGRTAINVKVLETPQLAEAK